METKNILVRYYFWRKSRTKQKTKNTTSKKRRFWVREIFRLRNTVGAGSSLVKEMRLNPNNRHSNFFRMSPETFDRLLVLVGPHISKSDLGREPISPGTRLAITLRFLASGDSMTSMSYLFRVGISTVSNILSETLPAIWNALQPLVLMPPDAEGWKKIANGFEHKWNFPNCIGGIDGKHVTIQAPPHAGSSYYNYKGRHSLVVMAVVDHVYRFILVDINNNNKFIHNS